MSQEQLQRPDEQQQKPPEPEAIKYGDIFNVSGELASQPITPKDAAAMQAAENIVFGQAQRGGLAAVMQSAADLNVKAGAVEKGAATADAVTVTEDHVEDKRVVTESIGGQVLGQYAEPARAKMTSPAGALDRDAVTIGEALEAATLTAGDKAVDRSDAAAIQAAEMRALGCSETVAGGIGAAAQAAAMRNPRAVIYEDKTSLSDVLAGATDKLGADKAVTAVDAEKVIGAEVRNNPKMTTTKGGVAESIAAAATFNYNK